VDKLKGDNIRDKLGHFWDDLQSDADHILDRDINKTTDSKTCFGVKQVNCKLL
jgi:hypothetical protein